MKRKALIFALAVISSGSLNRTWAATSDTITITVSLAQIISVSVTPNAWNIGAMVLSGTAGPSSFTATVGNTTTTLEIVGSDGAGGWTLGATAGLNQFAVAVSNPALTLTKVYQTLHAGVPVNGSWSFALTYFAPSQDNKGAGLNQSVAITLRASTPAP